MNTHPIPQKLLAGQALSAQDQVLLLANARRVQQAQAAGTLDTLLQGRHVALMAAQDGLPAQLFRQAGLALGAQVALVPPLAANASPAELRSTGRLLSQLYDAVECQGMPAALVRDIAQAASAPVFDGLSMAQQATGALGAELQALSSGQQSLVIQAVLLSVIA